MGLESLGGGYLLLEHRVRGLWLRREGRSLCLLWVGKVRVLGLVDRVSGIGLRIRVSQGWGSGETWCLATILTIPCHVHLILVPPLNQGSQQHAPHHQQIVITNPDGSKTFTQLDQGDSTAYTMLPPILQNIPYCQQSPSICSTLLSNVDLEQLVRLVGPSLGLGLGGGNLAAEANMLRAG